MSMFQILTQEGWTDIVVDVMRRTHPQAAIIVAFYFLTYHLFVTLVCPALPSARSHTHPVLLQIVLSLFVAVILDNLEMEEEVKKVKQLKAREQTTSMRSELPLRLRIFTRFGA
jgi:cobalamin biosynthesis protein CobD/CbiB